MKVGRNIHVWKRAVTIHNTDTTNNWTTDESENRSGYINILFVERRGEEGEVLYDVGGAGEGGAETGGWGGGVEAEEVGMVGGAMHGAEIRRGGEETSSLCRGRRRYWELGCWGEERRWEGEGIVVGETSAAVVGGPQGTAAVDEIAVGSSKAHATTMRIEMGRMVDLTPRHYSVWNSPYSLPLFILKK